MTDLLPRCHGLTTRSAAAEPVRIQDWPAAPGLSQLQPATRPPSPLLLTEQARGAVIRWEAQQERRLRAMVWLGTLAVGLLVCNLMGLLVASDGVPAPSVLLLLGTPGMVALSLAAAAALWRHMGAVSTSTLWNGCR